METVLMAVAMLLRLSDYAEFLTSMDSYPTLAPLDEVVCFQQVISSWPEERETAYFVYCGRLYDHQSRGGLPIRLPTPYEYDLLLKMYCSAEARMELSREDCCSRTPRSLLWDQAGGLPFLPFDCESLPEEGELCSTQD